MKTKLLLLVACITFSQVFTAQSISFTSALTEAQIGTTITVNYEYTIPADGNIYCAINLYNEWTWSSMVVDGVLSPAPAGTDVAGSFDFTIPPGTAQTADLTSPDNYKIVIELSDAGWNWLTGDYPATQINLQNTALSIKNSEFLEDVSMFYSNNRIHVKGLNTSDKYELKIFNLLGQEVKSITKDNNDVNLASAIYIAKLEVDGKGIKTSKVLIK